MSSSSHRNRNRKPKPGGRANSSGRTNAGQRVEKKAKPAKLRIIGGDMRGRIVRYHGGSFTRPMKDNIRENLFNILGPPVRGARCFDLFAGTGAMGFESLSRGASSAVMVEQNRQASRMIEETADTLGVRERCRIITGDAFHVASGLLGSPEDDTPWVVFLCPPYALWQESLAELCRIISCVLEHAPPGSMLVAETEKQFDVAQLPNEQWDIRDYGGTRLAIARPAMCCGLNL